MGLRTALARWLQPAATRRPDDAELSQLRAEVEKLRLDRPAFIAALEEMAERCHDILDRAESKRARATALESKRKKREEREESEQPELTDPIALRNAMKDNVRRLLAGR